MSFPHLLKVRTEINSEYQHIKEIQNTLSGFKSDGRYGGGGNQDFGSPFNDHSSYDEPPRDPDVWPPPTPAENRYFFETSFFQ